MPSNARVLCQNSVLRATLQLGNDKRGVKLVSVRCKRVSLEFACFRDMGGRMKLLRRHPAYNAT